LLQVVYEEIGFIKKVDLILPFFFLEKK
jgi:hypothetical protein